MKLIKNEFYSLLASNSDPLIVGVYTDEASEYIVEKHKIVNNHPFEYRLAIKREDGKIFHSWSLFQKIKNELVGAERVAIEVYPEESEVTDTANIYHLWVFESGYGPRVSLVKPF